MITIISIVDGLIDGSDPEDFAYDDEDDAAAAGVSANTGFMTWWGYLIPQSIAFGCASIAFIQEVRLYSGFAFVGLDLSWNAIDAHSKERAIIQGQQSFSPIGAAYNNFYHASFLANLTAFCMYVFHVGFGRAPNRFSGFWVCLWANMTAMLGYYMYRTYNARVNQFENCMVVDYRMVATDDAERQLREEEAALLACEEPPPDRRQPFRSRAGVGTVVLDGL